MCVFLRPVPASEITQVKDGTIHLQVIYSNKAKQSKVKTVAWTWLKSPKNSFLLRAETIVITEYTDRGKPGDAIILEEGMTREEAAEILDAEETERFGETKQFIRQQVLNIT